MINRLGRRICFSGNGDGDGGHGGPYGGEFPVDVMKVELLSGEWVVWGFASYVG